MRRGETVGMVRGHLLGDAAAEILGLVPGRGLDRQHHMQALAAGGLHEAFELEFAQPLRAPRAPRR